MFYICLWIAVAVTGLAMMFWTIISRTRPSGVRGAGIFLLGLIIMLGGLFKMLDSAIAIDRQNATSAPTTMSATRPTE